MNAVLLVDADNVNPENIVACRVDFQRKPPSIKYTIYSSFSTRDSTISLNGGVTKLREGVSAELKRAIAKAAGRLQTCDIASTLYRFRTHRGSMILIPLSNADCAILEDGVSLTKDDDNV